MEISRTAICPNPALLGPKLAPIEMTLIEEPMLCSQRSVVLPSLNTFIINFGIGIIAAMPILARNCYFAHRISSIDFPPGSGGEFLRDVTTLHIRNFGPWESLTSQFPKHAYGVFTDREFQKQLKAPRLQEAIA